MARRSIYVPGWLDRKLRALLPAEETVSAAACRGLEARIRALEGCEHEGGRLCAHCHAEVEAG